MAKRNKMWESLKKINPMTLAKYRSPRTKASNRRKNEAPRRINNHTFTLIVTQVTLSLFNSCLCCSWVICFKIRVFRFHSFLKLSIHHLNITCNQSKHAMRYVLVSSVLIKLHIPIFCRPQSLRTFVSLYLWPKRAQANPRLRTRTRSAERCCHLEQDHRQEKTKAFLTFLLVTQYTMKICITSKVLYKLILT